MGIWWIRRSLRPTTERLSWNWSHILSWNQFFTDILLREIVGNKISSVVNACFAISSLHSLESFYFQVTIGIMFVFSNLVFSDIFYFKIKLILKEYCTLKKLKPIVHWVRRTSTTSVKIRGDPYLVAGNRTPGVSTKHNAWPTPCFCAGKLQTDD